MSRRARLPGAAEPSNPYTTEPERSRWQAGFVGAQTDVRKKLS